MMISSEPLRQPDWGAWRRRARVSYRALKREFALDDESLGDLKEELIKALQVARDENGLILVPRAEAVKLFGMSAFADIQWAKNWSSSIGYSFDKVNNTNFQEPTAFHKGEYALVNILWTPADPVLTGFELQWGKRTDNDGNKGHDLRVQYSFKWSFSSKNLWELVE